MSFSFSALLFPCINNFIVAFLTIISECSSHSSSSATVKDWELYNESWNLLEKINSMEKSLERPSIDRKEALAPFMEWLAKHGAEMTGVELAADVPLYGFCVKSTNVITAGDLLFSIPRKIMLSSETAMSSEIGIIAFYN